MSKPIPHDRRVECVGPTGKFVALDRGEILIRHQAGTGKGPKLDLPKNAKIRDIVIPTAAPAGFNIWDWLPDRVEQALAEQEHGKKRRALIFPNGAMNVFEENNLRNRVWGPAAAEMGWRMEEYVTATGRRMALSRFTLHSLRDRYANTAIHEWGYTEEQLLQQGSWQDAETVRRFYSALRTTPTRRSAGSMAWIERTVVSAEFPVAGRYAAKMRPVADQELVHLLALLIHRPKGTSYLEVVDRIVLAGSPRSAWQESVDGSLFMDFDADLALDEIATDLAKWRAAGFDVTPFYDATYPAQLRDINEMPPVIWTKGALLAGDLGVSVVGTRRPTDAALAFVKDVVAGLVDQGRTVVSGLASGVDACAHRSAIACGGRTVAVIGTGIDLSYPEENRLLQQEISRSGLVLSQFWPGSAPTKKSFPMRNAVMSGYSRVSLIVEAGERSGTRIQARVAVAHGRPVILSGSVARQTTWGAALTNRPGVAIATSADSAVDLAVRLSRPKPEELKPYLALITA